MHGPADTNLAHGEGRTVMGGESGKMWPTLTSKKTNAEGSSKGDLNGPIHRCRGQQESDHSVP